MTHSTQELLPCPFCGQPGELEETGGSQASGFATHYRVNCKVYGCANMVWTTEQAEAITAWNTRIEHTPSNRNAVLKCAGEPLVDLLRQLKGTMVEVCEPNPHNPSPNIFPVERLALIAALTTTPEPTDG